ncbi:MAG: hypothetical protein ACKVQA_21175, partial [Burkholderiales bacterium]
MQSDQPFDRRGSTRLASRNHGLQVGDHVGGKEHGHWPAHLALAGRAPETISLRLFDLHTASISDIYDNYKNTLARAAIPMHNESVERIKMTGTTKQIGYAG